MQLPMPLLDFNIDRPFVYPNDEKKEIVLQKMKLTLYESQCISIMGPSACGKSTILKMIGGILPTMGSGRVAYSGTIFNEGDSTAPQSNIILLFQNPRDSLLPFLNVQENIRWAAKHSPKVNRREVDEMTNNLMHDLQLASERSNYPHKLSGGQLQRLNLARALAYKPQILLLDEPFSSLDLYAKYDLEKGLIELIRKYKLSIIMTTHDIEECLYCSDVVFILSNKPSHVNASIRILSPRDRKSVWIDQYRKLILDKIEPRGNIHENQE